MIRNYQELCRLRETTAHKGAQFTKITGPRLLETISTITPEVGPETIVMRGVLAILTILMILEISKIIQADTGTITIIVVMLNPKMLHLGRGGNSLLPLGEIPADLISRPMPTTVPLLRPLIRALPRDSIPMPRHRRRRPVNVTARSWRMMSRSLCQGTRLRDTPHHGKMVLMPCVRCICGIPTAPSFRISDCGLSCKLFIYLTGLIRFSLWI